MYKPPNSAYSYINLKVKAVDMFLIKKMKPAENNNLAIFVIIPRIDDHDYMIVKVRGM